MDWLAKMLSEEMLVVKSRSSLLKKGKGEWVCIGEKEVNRFSSEDV